MSKEKKNHKFNFATSIKTVKIKMKTKMKIIVGFISILLLASCGSIVRNQISKSLKKEIEEKNYPFPYHIYNKSGYEAFIGNAVPMTKPYLNDKVLSRIESDVQAKYPYHIKVAKEGIHSINEMLDYMNAVGILNEIGISEDTALAIIKKQNLEEHTSSNKSANNVSFSFNIPEKPLVYKPEFESISSVLISFPIYYPLEWKTQAQLIKVVSSSAEAIVLVPNQYWQQGVLLYLTRLGIALNNVKFVLINTDDVWTRDYGPTTVFSGKEQKPILLWNHYYQGYLPYQKFDADAGLSLGTTFDLPVYRLPLIIEGGNLLTAGGGTMVMFSSVLYNNPDVDSTKLKKIMFDYFGCENLILFSPLKGELTGHIDMVVKFISKDSVLVTKSKPAYKWYADFEKIAETLSKTISITGKPYKVFRIEMPETKNNEETFYSYINSLIVNDKVIVPLFSNAASDEIALATYKKLLPNKEIVGIYYNRYAVGSVHCQTKDIPSLK
jgi:agmatine deiminase